MRFLARSIISRIIVGVAIGVCMFFFRDAMAQSPSQTPRTGTYKVTRQGGDGVTREATVTAPIPFPGYKAAEKCQDDTLCSYRQYGETAGPVNECSPQAIPLYEVGAAGPVSCNVSVTYPNGSNGNFNAGFIVTLLSIQENGNCTGPNCPPPQGCVAVNDHVK